MGYRKENENIVDALSRREEESTLAQLNIFQSMWITKVSDSYQGDIEAYEAIAECTIRLMMFLFFTLRLDY